MYELMQLSASQLNAFYYEAFRDWEAEEKRKEDEKNKKEKERQDTSKRDKALEELSRKGVRLPANVLNELHERKKRLNKQSSDMDFANLNLEDLIDEFEG